MAKKHDIHKPWTLTTKSIACCQKSQIISCPVIHILKNERASKIFPMESPHKGAPWPKEKKKTKNKKKPLTQKGKWIFSLLVIYYIPFSEKFLQNSQFLKLSSDMPLFWNTIFSKWRFSVKLIFKKIKLRPNQTYIYIYIYIFLVELEFHLKIFKELEFPKLEFYTKTWFS